MPARRRAAVIDKRRCSQFVLCERSCKEVTLDPKVDTSRMTREINQMPPDVAAALEARGLTAAYNARPAYQQNDYIWWITSPKRQETRQKRLSQMLDELESGGVYMKMAWKG
jgi:uncharacterized protein YdeI (YjbR/CyaY-like superfamily)